MEVIQTPAKDLFEEYLLAEWFMQLSVHLSSSSSSILKTEDNVGAHTLRRNLNQTELNQKKTKKNPTETHTKKPQPKPKQNTWSFSIYIKSP